MTKSKKTKIDLFNVTNGPLWSLKGGWVSFLQSRGQKGPKIQFCHSEKSSWIRGTKLLPPLIWPKNRFPVLFGQIKEGVFEKNPLWYTPCLAQNDHFWPPEELFLAKNLENKVFLAHTIKNFTIWNPNVAPKKVTILGPTDTPWHPPGVQGGPKCIPSSLMMIQDV